MSNKQQFCLSEYKKEEVIEKLKKHSLNIDKIEFIQFDNVHEIKRFEQGYIFNNNNSGILLKSLYDYTNSNTTLHFMSLKDSIDDDLRRNLILNGFQISEINDDSIIVKKPSFEIGAKSSIKKGTVEEAQRQWLEQALKIDMGDDDEEIELIDESELLSEEDLKPMTLNSEKSCVPERKACANCTCGRGKDEAIGEKIKLTKEMIENPQSACGNCPLGDAYRCSTCPYMGLPAFEPGKKIEIPENFLIDDI